MITYTLRSFAVFCACALSAAVWAQGSTGATLQSDPSPIQKQSDGSYVIKTTSLSKDVKGFKGTTPLAITVRNDTVVSIKPLRNRETAEYFQQAQQMLRAWEGNTIADALALQVDGITGATLSCDALRENVRLGLTYYKEHK